jgi:hypothetical protein
VTTANASSNVIRNLMQQQHQHHQEPLFTTQKRLSKKQLKNQQQQQFNLNKLHFNRKQQQRNSVNIRQRKYHMLYQPRVCSIVQ